MITTDNYCSVSLVFSLAHGVLSLIWPFGELSAQFLSQTSEPLIAWFSHPSPPSAPGFQDLRPKGYLSREKRSVIALYYWKTMFLILQTDCVITRMFFHGLKARGISLVYALTPTIGKTEPFLKVLIERCWLDLRNPACISSSSWGKQFCAVCFLGEAWENSMKMISFSLQQAYLMLAGKHWNKGKVEAFVFHGLY